MSDSMRGLRTFCVAARRLSFKEAADELCVTPSAVSHQIRVLEDSLGVTLFERLTREIALSEPGAALYARLEPLMIEIDQVTSSFKERLGQRRLLRVTLPPFFASEMLVPRLTDFARGNASLQIHIETIESGTPHPATSDASILLLARAPREFSTERLFSLSLVPACSPEVGERIDCGDPATLLDQTLIVHKSRPSAWREWFHQRSLTLEEAPSVLYLDSMFAVARAAQRSVGVALVPLPLSESWFGSGALMMANSAPLTTSDCYYLVYRDGDLRNADVRTFRDWVIATFAKPELALTVG